MHSGTTFNGGRDLDDDTPMIYSLGISILISEHVDEEDEESTETMLKMCSEQKRKRCISERFPSSAILTSLS